MRTARKIILRTLLVLVSAIALTLAGTAVGNAVASANEAARLVPYGERVDVGGRQMNVVVSGSGEETLVLLPGFGTAAPGIDFAPLVAELERDFRVVVVEPFGSGLSDDTSVPRTSEAYVAEVHAALAQLGIDRYALVAHSIAGVYSLAYANRFPGEVTAFVGIDSSVPDQPGAAVELPVGLMRTLSALGLTRQLDAAGPDPLEGLPYTAEQREQNRILTLRNGTNDALFSEAALAGTNFSAASGETFPAELPVLLIIAEGDDGEVAGWQTLHEAQAAAVDRGEVVLIPGDHYLHHEHSPEIAERIRALLIPAG
ncbi:alpha/beta fold hydrolase [Leucobacter sp. PH1c]|uniref:alpha/beta fold hydrolase n=1 Tax=Leucobacter sp. PH1c TaxID=1397278 RepID=UPI00046AEBFE|nr:alpha/beta hydrolase [Leucobacter sp. PH1c]